MGGRWKESPGWQRGKVKKRAQEQPTRYGHWKTVVVVCFGGCLLLAVAVGQWRGFRVASQGQDGQSSRDFTPAAFLAASPSKEYAYASGRLVATEQANLISPTHKSFSAAAANGSITVTAGQGLTWTAVASSPNNFVSITSGGSGSGNGTVNYSVALNSGTSIRSGTITFSGQAFPAQVVFTVYQGKNFVDVPTNHPYYEFIGRIAARGVTLGCNSDIYCPNQIVNREQMAAFIIRALGDPSPPTPPSQRFLDVPPSNPFYAFIEQMAVRQITLGCGGGNYCPTQPVLHEQMATFMMRALGLFNPPAPATQRFPDVPPTNQFYKFIDAYAERGIWNGGTENWDNHPEGGCTPGDFCPTKGVSRAQMAKILANAFAL